jgi:23S rRNA pseudouridine1911/1915/1917 synthase
MTDDEPSESNQSVTPESTRSHGSSEADVADSGADIQPLSVDVLSDEPIDVTVESRAHGWRLDHYLCRLFPNYSRTLFQKGIAEGAVLVNGLSAKSARRLRVNDCLSVRLPTVPDSTIKPENIPLDVIHEDDAIVVINKPAGMIVHPGRGNYSGTLTSALQFHFDKLSDVAGRHRPGIVHRLDRDTSGVIVIAKDNQVHSRLSLQFEKREVKKKYLALVWGEPQLDGDFIHTYVRTHAKIREKMCVCPPGGGAREASTFYEVAERLNGYALMALYPRTGRTHQLRVHMAHLGHPLLADRMYGGRSIFRTRDISNPNLDSIRANEKYDDVLIKRQSLHACRLEFTHPTSGKNVAFEATPADDFANTLEQLRRVAADR